MITIYDKLYEFEICSWVALDRFFVLSVSSESDAFVAVQLLLRFRQTGRNGEKKRKKI